MEQSTLSCFLITRQVTRPEYCQLNAQYFRSGRLAPQPGNMDDIVDTWSGLEQTTKERWMFATYLLASGLAEDEGYGQKRFAAELYWILRRCFAGETDKVKLRWHFENMCNWIVSKELLWVRSVGIVTLLDSYRDSRSQQFDENVSKIFALFMENCEALVKIVRILWKFLQFVTDVDRFNRKVSACRVIVAPRDCLLIEQFEKGDITDAYMKGLKEIYGSAWREMAIGRLLECSSCGARRHHMWTCGLCMQEQVRKKARYCDPDCQTIDWSEHRRRHKSRFDGRKFATFFRDFDFVNAACIDEKDTFLSFKIEECAK